MPLELDLTGCCFICYLPLIAGPAEERGPGKVCPWDASHTPRVRLAGPQEAQELLGALSPDLRLERPCSLGGAELRAGAELLVAEKQAFRIDRGRSEALDPPDTKDALAAALEEYGGRLQLTFRNPRPASALLLALEPPAPGAGSSAVEPEDDGAVLLPARDAPRRRVDPADGSTCTWREFRERNDADMGPGELYRYWCGHCRPVEDQGMGGSSGSSAPATAAEALAAAGEPVKGRGRGRGRGRGQAEPAARAVPVEEAPNGKLAELAEASNGRPPPPPRDAAGGGPAPPPLARDAAGGGPAPPPLARDAAGGGPAPPEEVPNGKPTAGPEVVANGHGAFDAAAWLRQVETTGVLSAYAEALSANFSSPAQLRQAYGEQGREQFYRLAGITKLGHKRLIDKVIGGE